MTPSERGGFSKTGRSARNGGSVVNEGEEREKPSHPVNEGPFQPIAN